MAGCRQRRSQDCLRHHLGDRRRVHLDVAVRGQLRRLSSQRGPRATRVVGVVVRHVDRGGHAARNGVRVAHPHRRNPARHRAAAGVRAQDHVRARRAVQPPDLGHGRRLRRSLHRGRDEHGDRDHLCTDLPAADREQLPRRHQSVQRRFPDRAALAGVEPGRRMESWHPAARTTHAIGRGTGHRARRDCAAGVLPDRRLAEHDACGGPHAHRRRRRGIAPVARFEGTHQQRSRCAVATAHARTERRCDDRIHRQDDLNRQRRRVPGVDVRRHGSGARDPCAGRR